MANMTTQEILQGIKDWAAPKVIYDISAAHNNTKYADLSDALGTNGGNIPQEYKKGGITVRFVRTYDNKYVQYRYMGTDVTTAAFTNVANWQGVNVELVTNGKYNLVEGNGVSSVINSIYKSGIAWVSGYYDTHRSIESDERYQCASIDLTYIDYVTLKSVGTLGGACCYLIKNNGAVKQQWNNTTINTTIDTRDCSILLLSNLITYNDWEIGFVYSDVDKLYKSILSKSKGFTEHSISVLFDETDISFNVESGIALDYSYDVYIKQGDSVKLTLNNTDLLSTVALNLFIGYTDNTESSGILLNPETTIILEKDVQYLRFKRTKQGVVGTGTITVTLCDESSLSYNIEDLNNRVNYIENEVVPKIISDTEFLVPVVLGQTCNFTKEMKAEANDLVSVHLSQTELLATGGFNLFFGYTDGTESSGVLLPINGTYSVTLPKKLSYLRFNRKSQGVIGTGNVSIFFKNNSSLTSLVKKCLLPPIYVSTNNGDDSNDGKSINTAKKTINAAIESGAEVIYVEGGTYYERIDLTKSTTKRVNITGIEGENSVIIMPAGSILYNAGEEENISGYENVCKIATDVDLSGEYIRLFFDGMNDVSTLIPSSEVHPCQRGKTYRCDCTMIVRATSSSLSDALTEINTSDSYKFYYDSTEHELYFKKPTSPTNVYPLIYPRLFDHLITTNHNYTIELVNLEFRYGRMNLNGLENARLIDCASKYVFRNGCFSYENCMNVEFVRCEAARCYSDNGRNGDGFNSSTIHTLISRGCSAKMEDCWSHDNNDDGYSDHDGQNTVIDGGLFEYNGKGGVTPARGSSCVCKNVLSRKNYNGFYYILSGSFENEGSMMLYNCISESNSVSGFRVENNRMAILYNCIAIDEVIGFKCESGSTMRLIDCKHYGCTTVKDGSVSIVNGSSVE